MHITLRRRHALRLLALSIAVAGIGSAARAEDPAGFSLRHGKLFMSTNAQAANGGNQVLVYARSSNGPATLIGSVPTQGTGTGAGLGSQGAVALSGNGRFLFVVNAGSNSVSTFKVGSKGLVLGSVVASGGQTPVSVAESNGLVYVVNAGGSTPNVAGFRNLAGHLVAIGDGVRSLDAGSAPAQVSFDRDGEALVVTEKATSVIVAYTVRNDGTLGTTPLVTPSSGTEPFGFGITRQNVLVVSEAPGSTVSSYQISENPGVAVQLVSPSVPNGQAAACWIAVTPDGHYAYSANAASSSISSYGIDGNGALTLLQAQAGLTGSNAGVLDMAVSRDGAQLHAFASKALQIVSFNVAYDGSLTPIGSVGGMPAGAAGLAAN